MVTNAILPRPPLPPLAITASSPFSVKSAIIKLVLKNSSTVKERIQRLLNDEPIEVKIDLETIIVGIENNEDNIWGLMVQTGYLKVNETINKAEGIYKVKIPNYEIKLLFTQIIESWFKDKVIGNDLESILKDLVTLNFKEYEKKFEILVNRESGLGRYDIMLEPKDKDKNSFIMEFKVLESKEEKDIEETIENAKKQIEEKGYEQNLKERGFKNITKMVYAFKGKEVKIEIY